MTALLAVCLSFSAAATVAGTVVDAAGTPVPQARVFLETSLGAPLLSAVADANGRYRIETEGPATVGVFAIAEGHAFGGATRTLAIDEVLDEVTLRLGRPGSISGRVRSAQTGDAITGAQVIGVALLGTEKVSIHFPKLRDHGFAVPTTGDGGRFSVAYLPTGTPVALKIAHGAYAQEGVADVTVGGGSLDIEMYPGVLLRGDAMTRAGREPVANVVISFANAQPPHDTALVQTDALGAFSLRLKPGVYLYRAESSRFRSPSWRRLTLRGDAPMQRVSLQVSEVATIFGEIRDAVSSAPVTGARVSLRADGLPAGQAETGPTGRFHFEAAAGANELVLEGAPGYRAPERSAQVVTVAEGQAFQMPTLWLTPIPTFSVSFIDGSDAPVPGVIARLLEPAQLGWHVADDAGTAEVRVQTVPASGVILGLAEHPRRDEAALFALEPDAPGEARVALMPCEPVTGRVVNERGAALSTAVVGLLLASPHQDEPHILWRTLTDRDGRFTIPRGIPGTALRCIAITGSGATTQTGESAPFVIAEGTPHDTGNIVVTGGRSGQSLMGRRLPVDDLPVLCGEMPGLGRNEAPLVVTYSTAAEAPFVRDRLAADHAAWAAAGHRMVLVVDGAIPCDPATPFPILRGSAPATATTYLTDGRGRVTAEHLGVAERGYIPAAITAR